MSRTSRAIDYGTGQKTGITTDAVPLGESFPCNEVLVQAEHDNTDLIRVGPAGGQFIVLDAKESIILPINDVNDVYVKAESGTQKANWIAR